MVRMSAEKRKTPVTRGLPLGTQPGGSTANRPVGGHCTACGARRYSPTNPPTLAEMAVQIIVLPEDDPDRARLEENYWAAVAFDHGIERMNHWRREYQWLRGQR